jgi:tripartite-type tricarboxylate transporter receptor subunit TctC
MRKPDLLRFAVALACLLVLAVSAAHGQMFPNRPLRIINAFPAGSGTDLIARVVASKLSPSLGQPVVVENRPGAAGNIGAEAAAKSSPDGYTLFIGVSIVLASSRALYPNLAYDVVKDFAPVARLGSTEFVLVAHPSLPAKSIKELVALARTNAGRLNYASAGGTGSGSHLAAELFKSRTGIDLTHIGYKGGPPAVTALVGGETDLGFMTVPVSLVQINAGRLKALAVSSPKRSAVLPDVPTIAESGYPGFDVAPNYGLYVPAATPRGIVALLNAEVRKALGMKDVQERFATQGVSASSSTPEELGASLAAEIVQWAQLIKAANIHPD